MNKTILIIGAAILISGCWQSTIETTNTANVNSINIQTASNTNVQNSYNGAAKETVNGFPIPANANVTVVNGSNVRPLIQTRPAPDNSEVSLEMNDKGQPVQTRAFKNHPVLLKVEKIYINPKQPEFKVYLKNGKVLPLESGKIADFLTAAPQEILEAVEVQTKVDGNVTIQTERRSLKKSSGKQN